jgi:cyclophilin family peptidyl-prolyl cis-trans isomerase
MRLLMVIVVVALGAGLVAESAASDPNIPSVSTCRKAGRARPRSEHLKRPPQTVKRGDHLLAVVKTNCGDFTIKLEAARSPTIVNSFAYLARHDFFDGLAFDRVAPHFVIEGGDPRDNGTGGPGYTVVEPPPARVKYRTGTVAMANAEREPRGSAGSNFFVVVGQGGAIPPRYPILGQIRAGMGTVRRIDDLGLASQVPSQTVRIESVRIRARGDV